MPMLAVHLSIVQEVVDALDIDELREHIGDRRCWVPLRRTAG